MYVCVGKSRAYVESRWSVDHHHHASSRSGDDGLGLGARKRDLLTCMSRNSRCRCNCLSLVYKSPASLSSPCDTCKNVCTCSKRVSMYVCVSVRNHKTATDRKRWPSIITPASPLCAGDKQGRQDYTYIYVYVPVHIHTSSSSRVWVL